MKILLNFKILLCLILLGTNSFAEVLKIDCGSSWWNVEVDTKKINKISVHRVGDVFFKVDDGMLLKWYSDFNEGIIDLFSGRARVTKDNSTGDLLGQKFNCNISTSYKKNY